VRGDPQYDDTRVDCLPVDDTVVPGHSHGSIQGLQSACGSHTFKGCAIAGPRGTKYDRRLIWDGYSMIPYLVIGRGRLSRHVQHYLALEAVEFEHWDRTSEVSLEHALAGVRTALLLISDDAVESVLDRYARQQPPLWVHCSGCVTTPLAESAHPLMLFGEELYDIDTYRRVPFITESGRRPFSDLFPELRNPHATVEPDLKPIYHALCSLGGNFTTMLWQKVFAESEATLGVDRTMFFPYLEQVARNLTTCKTPLTGPLVRGDDKTVEHHLRALSGDPFEAVYRAFVSAYRSDSALRAS